MSSNNFRESLESVALNYHLGDILDDKQFDHMFHSELAKRIAQHLRPGDKVLELGYGEGTVSSELFLSKSVHRHIVEGSKRLAESAASALGDKAIIENCLFSEYQPKFKFDIILATNVFEHVENTRELFSLIHQWLKPDGKCIITVPNSESFHRRIAVAMKIQKSTKDLSERDHLVGHLRVYDLAQISHEVRINGFEITHVSGMVIKFLNNSLQQNLPLELVSALHTIADLYPAEYAANLYLEVKKL
jgi:2-polyprenyl-3-methyl-5-hydroxy-6-metoxy-1,4-benzoquinol methylase